MSETITSPRYPGWPPKPGDTIFFEVNDRVMRGTLREIHQGLLWIDFLLDDETVVSCYHLVMCPVKFPLRDLDSISAKEVETVKQRVKQAGLAGINIQKDARLWSDFVQYLTYTWLQTCKRQDAELAALGGVGPDTKPS